MNKVTSYIKNMGKSIKYSAVEEIKKNAESSSSFIETNQDLFKEVYSAARNYKRTIDIGHSAIKSSKVYAAVDAGVKAAFQDLKTGNFYNTKRIEEFENKAAGSFLSDDGFEDFDMDFSFDDEDLNFDDEETSSTSSQSQITKGDVYVGSSISKATQMSAELTANTIAKTGKFIVDANKASTSILLSQNAQLMAGVRTSIAGVHESINDVYKFMTSTVQTHAQNSKTFYEQNTSMMQEQTAILKEMLEMQRNLYKKEDEKSSSNQITYDDVVDAYGMPNLKEYAKIIKQNAKKMMGSTGDMLLGDTFGEGSNMMLAFAASPLSFIPNTIVRSMIPKTLAKASKELDASLSGAFSTMIARLNKMAKNDFDGGIFSYIGKLLGIDNNLKTTIDTKNYNKGAVPFDGIVRKSIVEVIPQHLARIESLLSGQTERTFDYENGKWVKVEDIAKQFQDMKDNYVTGAFSDIKSEMNDYIREMRKKKNFNAKDQKELENNFFKIMQTIFDEGGYFNPNNPGEDYEYLPDFDKFLELYKRTSRHKQIGLAGNVMNKRSAMNKEMQRLEKEGSMYGLLFNNANFNSHLKLNKEYNKTIVERNNASVLMAVDAHNYTIFDYLKDIDEGIRDIVVNGINVFTQRGGRIKGGKRKRQDVSIKRKQSEVDRLRELSMRDNEIYSDRDDDIMDSSMLDSVQKRIYKDELSEFNDYGNTAINRFFEGSKEKADKALKGVKGDSYISKFIYSKGLKYKFAAVTGFLSDLTSKPASLLTGLIEKADLAIYDLLFQKEPEMRDEKGNKIKGLMNAMIFKLETGINSLVDRFEENILKPLDERYGLNDKFKDIKQKIKDKFNSNEYVQAIKDEFSGAFTFAKDTTKEVYAPVVKAVKNSTKTKDQIYQAERRALINKMINERAANSPVDKEIRSLQKAPKDYDASVAKAIERIQAKKEGRRRMGTRYREAKAATENTGDADPDPDIQSHADGIGYVSKSGLTAISEGEAIIPADLNPFNPNRGKASRERQRAAERRIKSKYSKEAAQMLYDDIQEYADGKVSKKYAADIRKVHSKDYMDGILVAAKNGFVNAKDIVTSHIDIPEKDTEKIKGIADEALNQVLEKGPKVVAKSVLGGTLGLLSGVVGGPLLGAGIGAATGIIQDSDKLKNFLFGKVSGVDENGKPIREGGKLASKETQETIKKYFPDMSKFGIAGAVTGLITPLGPIGGLMVGSAIGFAKNNSRISEALFGDEDGLLNKKRKQALKKAYPNIAAGALAGMMLGPFGLVGNAMLGSAVGMVTSTDEFKDVIFGVFDENTGKRIGGLVGTIRESVIDPLKEFSKSIVTNVEDFVINDMINPLKDAVDPIATEIKRAVLAIPNLFITTVSDRIGRPLEKFVAEKFIEPMAGLTKKVFNVMMKPVKFALSAPSKAIGWVGNNLRAKQIVQGRADYMSAQERLDFAAEHQGRIGRYKHSLSNRFGIPGLTGRDYTGFDSTLAGMDQGQLLNLNSDLQVYLKGDKALQQEHSGIKSEIFNFVDQYFSHKGGFLRRNDRSRILNAINKEKYGEAQRLIAKAKAKDGSILTEQEYTEISNKFGELTGKLVNIKNRRKNLKTQGKEPIAEALKKAGVDVRKMSNKDIKRVQKYVQNEAKYRLDSKDDPQAQQNQAIMAASEQSSIAIVSKLDELKEVMERIVDNYTGAETQDQINKTEKINKSVNKQYQKGKAKKSEATKKRFDLFKDLGYTNILKDKAGKDAVARAPQKTIDMIVSAARNGHPFAEEDLIQVLGITDEKSINRLNKFTEIASIPKNAVDKFIGNGRGSAIRGSVFARVLAAADAGVDFMNEDGTLNEDIFKKVLSTKTDLKFTDLKNNPNGKLRTKFGNLLRQGKDKVSTALSGHMSENKASLIKDLKKAGIIGVYLTENEALDMNISTLQTMVKNPEAYKQAHEKLKDQELQDAANSSQSADIGLLARLKQGVTKKTKKLKTIFTMYGPKQYYEDEQGNIEMRDTAETNATEEKEKEAQATQKGILSGLTGLKDGLFGFFKGKNNDEEADEKTPFWKTLLSGLFGSKVGGVVVAGAGLGLLGMFKKWWDTTDEDSPIKKFINGIGDKLSDFWTNTASPWLAGEGKFKDGGFPKVFHNFLLNMIGGFEWVMTNIAPKLVSVLVKTLPGVIWEGVKALGSLITTPISWLWGGGEDKQSEVIGAAKDLEKEIDSQQSLSTSFGVADFGGYISKQAKDIASIMGETSSTSTSTKNNITTSTTTLPTTSKNGSGNTTSYTSSQGVSVADASGNTRALTGELYAYDNNGKKVKVTEKDIVNGKYESIYSIDGSRYDYNSSSNTYIYSHNNDHTNDTMLSRGTGFVVNSTLRGTTGIAGKMLSSTGRLLDKGRFKLLSPINWARKGVGKSMKVTASLGEKGSNLFTNIKNSADNFLNPKEAAENVKFEQLALDLGDDAGEAVAKNAAKEGAEAAGKSAFKNLLSNAKDKVLNTNAVNKVLNSNTGKTVTNAAGKAKNAFDKVTNIPKDTLNKFLKFIKDSITGFFENNTVISKLSQGMKGSKDSIKKKIVQLGQKVINSIIEKLPAKLIKGGAKIASKLASFATVVLPIALMVFDFITGMDNAEGILGVEETSFLETILAGIIRAITNQILLGIFTDTEVVSFFIDIIFPFVGIDVSGFQARRKKAQEACDKYNEENHSHYSLYEYLTRNDWTTKISNVWNGAKDFVGQKFNDAKNWAAENLDPFGWFESDNEKKEREEKERKSAAASNSLLGFANNVKNISTQEISKYLQTNKDLKSSDSETLYDENGNPISPVANTELGLNTMFDVINNNTGVGLANINNSIDGAMTVLDKRFGLMFGLTDKNGNIIPLTQAAKLSDKQLKEMTGVYVTPSNSYNTTSRNSSSAANGVFGIGASVANTLASMFSGKGTKQSGILPQVDPSIAGMKFNIPGDSTRQTVGDSGCGPIAAQTILNAYTGRGPSIQGAVDFALKGGYKEKDAGVTPDYFGDYLGNYGIATSPTDNMNEVYNNIASGRPTVLMGIDPSGRPKQKTPYGTNSSHYVVASGIDNKGNIIIQDPESKTPNTKYKAKDVLSKTQLGITTSLAGRGIKQLMSKIKGKHGFAGFGRGSSTVDQDLGVWSPLTAQEINAFIKSYAGNGRGFSGKGDYFVKAADASGLDPRYILAHAALESSWGDSTYAKAGNFFGIGAYDSNPDNAYKYGNSSMQSGLVNGAVWIRKNYYDAGQKTLWQMQNPENGWHIYATSSTWANEIASIMDAMPKNSNATYHEGSGETVSGSDTSSNSNSIFGIFDSIGNTIGQTTEKYINPAYEAFDGISNAYTGGLTSAIFGSSDSGSETGDATVSEGDVSSAKAFYEKYNGVGVDYDGAYGVQCVDLFKQYADEVVGLKNYVVGGNGGAYNIANDSKLNNYFDKVSLSNAKFGDWVIWGPYTNGGGKYGHVAMYTGMEGDRIKAFGTNQGGNNEPANIVNLSSSGVTAVLRAKTSSGMGTKKMSAINRSSNTVDKHISKQIRNTSMSSMQRKLNDMNGVILSKKDIKANSGQFIMPTSILNARGITELPTISSVNTTSISNNQYDQLLNTIIQALLAIVDNTDNLSKIVELLSSNLGVNVSEEELKSTNSNNTAAIKQKLLNAMRNNGGSKNGFGTMLMEKDNSYLINAMNAIARG